MAQGWPMVVLFIMDPRDAIPIVETFGKGQQFQTGVSDPKAWLVARVI